MRQPVTPSEVSPSLIVDLRTKVCGLSFYVND